MFERVKVRFSNLVHCTNCSILLWGCSAASGTGTLKKVNGTMKEEDYLQILQLHLKSTATVET